MARLMAVVALVAVLSSGTAEASNIVARMAKPTPAAVGYMADVEFGTSPRPTHPPGLPHNVPRELMRRQNSKPNSGSNSQASTIPYPPPGFYCGLVEGDAANALTCVNARANCVYTGNAVGCCISKDIQSCTNVATTCVGWDDECDADCRKDPRIMQCTITTQPYCAAFDFGGSSTLWACQEVSAPVSSVQPLSDYFSSELGPEYTTLGLSSRSVSSQSKDDDETRTPSSEGSMETEEPPDVGESTATPTSDPQDGSDDEDGGSSSDGDGEGGGGLGGGAIAGIVVGVVAAVAALVAFLAWIFFVKRKQQPQQPPPAAAAGPPQQQQQPPVAEHQYPPQQPPPPQGGPGAPNNIPAAVAGGYYLPENKANEYQPPGYATYDASNPQRTFTPPPANPQSTGQQSPALSSAQMYQQQGPREMPDSSYQNVGHHPPPTQQQPPPPPQSCSPNPADGVSSPGSGSAGPSTPGNPPGAASGPGSSPGLPQNQQQQQPIYEMGTGN